VAVRVVFFDVGETLVDETRAWASWAEWMGVPTLTFFGVLGAVIERREHHFRAFQILRPGFDVRRERAAREAAGQPVDILPEDLYPDARPCLDTLKAQGYAIGLAGNQLFRSEEWVRALDLPADVIASSAGLGVEKPSPGFFLELARSAGADPAECAYVGDRVDNDVLPAKEAGMVAVFIRRGPWGNLQAEWPEAERADIRIDSLAELPEALARWDAAGSRSIRRRC
jgi:HAD superfamily hydrolase (TIGR01662 family)